MLTNGFKRACEKRRRIVNNNNNNNKYTNKIKDVFNRVFYSLYHVNARYQLIQSTCVKTCSSRSARMFMSRLTMEELIQYTHALLLPLLRGNQKEGNSKYGTCRA